MNRLCPTGCGRSVRPGHLMCAICWARVPKDLQQRVYATWRAFNSRKGHGVQHVYDDYVEASEQAIQVAAR